MNPAEPIRRTYEIEDKTNLFLVHPLSNRLVPLLAHWRVSPNAVSMCGMACGLFAGLAYHRYTSTVYCVLGFVLMIGWHVMDGADGQLARLTRTQSATGKVLDGICDYVTFTAVYVGLASSLSGHYGHWVWWIVAASGACHAIQSASYELQRQDFDHWGCGRLSAAPVNPKTTSDGQTSAIRHMARVVDRLYIGLQLVSTGVEKGFRCQMETTLAHSPTRSAMMALYRDVFARRVRAWSVLSANYRTLGLFVFAVAGFPLYYFIWEIVALSLLTVFLLCGQRNLYRTFFRRAHALEQTAA
jgi:phosphatidylglycerophosphate synthase